MNLMSAFQLKAMLDTAWKVVDNAGLYFACDCLNFRSDGCRQCSNGGKFALVDIVLEEPLEEETLVGG